jgi:hypothetical protein
MEKRKEGIFHVGACSIYWAQEKHNILIRKFNENYLGDPKIDKMTILN